MTCYHPISAWQQPEPVTLSGKSRLSFKPPSPYSNMVPIQVPCGGCIGCRQLRSIHWATRCVHEAQLHARNCFITLTFNSSHLPSMSLQYEIFQEFMKRLRKKFVPKCPFKAVKKSSPFFHLVKQMRADFFAEYGIRFYMAGEYGDNLGRPHFHACLFNIDFDDKKLWSVRNGVRLYVSETLDQIWSDPISGLSMGFSTIGDVTFESAGYIARYIMKRITGDAAYDHYGDRVPEFNRMSLKPGIGEGWFDRYGMTDVFPHDRVILKGRKVPVPRYYDKLLKELDPSLFDMIKHNRMDAALNFVDDSTPDRLKVKELVHQAKLNLLKRGIDHEL